MDMDLSLLVSVMSSLNAPGSHPPTFLKGEHLHFDHAAWPLFHLSALMLS